MRIRMTALMAGPDGVVFPGQVVDVSPEHAKSLMDGGFAVVAEKPQSPQRQAPESTAIDPPEKAVIPKASKAAAALAEEHDLNLAEIEGSGKDGLIIKPDVENVIAAGDDETE